ncbi:MAG TPA: ABC transporter permease [Vicinamibacterales bacterium]|nr:ABC transporter permease [Vicinamibacterales bacterium]
MRTLLSDLRHGVRLLLGAPGFTAVAVAALAIGIGANSAIFSVVNTLLLERLPYGEPERLVVVWEHNIPRDRKNNVVSPGNFIHWREMNQVFEDIAAVGLTFNLTLTGHGDPVEIPFQYVTASFFPIVGVQPAMGRIFTPEEDRPRSQVVVISDRLWRSRLNSDPAVLTRGLTLEGEVHSVVGVMPPGFSFLDKTVDLWAPVGFPAEARTPRGRWLMTVAKLEPGVTAEQAQRDMTRVAGELTTLFPNFNTGWTARVVPLRDQLTGDIRPALLLMLGAVAFVLLIACANVANLLLARATSRQRELAVRAALGAGRGRIVRQLLAESLVLAVAGGATGLALAWWSLQLLRAFVADRLPVPRLEQVGIDGPVLGFTVAASLLAGLIFGLVPAFSAAGARLTDALKEGGRTGSAGRGKRTRSVFVVVEIALALVLLVGAGLLVRSFVRLMDVDAGFDTERTVTMRVSLPQSRYRQPVQRIQFFDRLFERIDRIPGVQSSGAVTFLPLTGLGSATRYEVVGQPVPPAGQEPVTDVRIIANQYFKAMGIPLVRGRLFDPGQPADAQNRIIVNEALARHHWPNEDPIGKRIKVSWTDNRQDEIIGVVGDVRHAGLDTEARSMTYWPHARDASSSMTLTVRTAAEPPAAVSAIRGILRDQDPELALADVKTMDEVVSRSVAQRRLLMMLLGIFAAAAMLLAAVGIYGVIAYSVTQRTREIGIRLALGAQRSDVLRMIVGQAARLALAGIVIGAAGAAWLTRLMADLLFEVRPLDPLTFAGVAAVLGSVALLASYLPGRRATRVDPVVALRAE